MVFEFENSPEFDLFNSAHATSFIEQYGFIRQMYISEYSTIFLLKSIQSKQLFTLKAIKKTVYFRYDFEKFHDLKHKNIVPVIEHFETDKYYYVVKPFIDGIDLNEYVKLNGPLNKTMFNCLTKQLIEIFKYLHDRSEPLIFRDLKPSNIIVLRETSSDVLNIVLIDIETMRINSNIKTLDTFFVMSRGYTSPEQYGFRQTDIRSDIYSLGATLYYAKTGCHPTESEITLICKAKFHDINDTLFFNAIAKCLSFNPKDRYKDIHAFENALCKTKYCPKQKTYFAMLIILVFILLSTYLAYSIEDFKDYNKSNTSLDDDSIYKNNSKTEQEEDTNSSYDILLSKIHASADITDFILNRKEPDASDFEMEPEIQVEKNLYNNQHLIASHSGVYITKTAETDFTIWVNRNELSNDKKEFVYVSVFSFSDEYDEKNFKAWSEDAVTKGYGLQEYNELLGFRSRNPLQHSVVFLFNSEKKLVGAVYFKNIR